MNGARSLTALAIAVLVAGCGDVASSPSVVPAPSTPSSSAGSVAAASPSALSPSVSAPAIPSSPTAEPTASPSPSVRPTIRALTVEEAASAYLAVRVPFDEAIDQLVIEYSLKARCAWTAQSGPCTQSEWEAGRAYWSGHSAALKTYIAGLRRIAFPDVAASLARAYIEELANSQQAAQAAARATTLDAFNELVPAAATSAADTHDYDPWQRLMDALGLPVGP